MLRICAVRSLASLVVMLQLITERETPQALPRATIPTVSIRAERRVGVQLTLAGDVDVRSVLVLAEQRKMEQDSQGGGISREDDKLGGTTVESLGGCRTETR